MAGTMGVNASSYSTTCASLEGRKTSSVRFGDPCSGVVESVMPAHNIPLQLLPLQLGPYSRAQPTPCGAN